MMKHLRLLFSFAALLSVATSILSAAVPPPERLVGRETTLLFTVPDWSSALAAFEKTSTSGLLKDPAMKPLVEKVVKDFKESITSQMNERDQGYMDEFLKLVNGQVTFVLGDLRDIAKNPGMPPLTFIFDVKDRQADLSDFMDRSLKDEDEAQVIREKVAGGEVISLITKNSDNPSHPEQMFFGLSDSMLGISFKKKNVSDLIRRKNGDLQNSLADNPTFRADQARFFRNAKGYLWANVEEMVKLAKANIEKPQANSGNPFAMSLDVGRILDALGLNGWKSVAIASDFDSRGADMQLFLNVPEPGRKGLFKLLETEHRATAPPLFVTDDVAKFMRWRKSGEEALQIIEKTMTEAVPPFAGFVTMMIDQAGKMKNPDFNFRRQFIGNLGDDIISIQKTAKELTLDAIGTPPTLYLIGSGNPDALLDAMMTAQSSMGIPGMISKEEEFLGKRIFGMPAGVKIGVGGKPQGQRHIYATTARGYMAIGTERELVEDFIRGGSKANGLTEISGFRQAAEKVGGLGTGWFFYENPAETLNMLLTSFKQNPNALQDLFGPFMFKAIVVNPNKPAGKQPQKSVQERVAEYVKLLPDFDQIAKYLSFTVGSAMTDAEGILVRSYTPDGPGR
jgi:hypothetical protein